MSRIPRDPLAGLIFDWRSVLKVARERLRLPPEPVRIERPRKRGEFVRDFVLPLDLCLGTNRTRHSRPGQHEDVKKKILGLLRTQAGMIVARQTLPGVPQVLCTRFSAVEPDAYADWGKMAVDLLCVPAARRYDGLGLLRDDRPKDAEIKQWWEQGRRGEGFVYIEVRA